MSTSSNKQQKKGQDGMGKAGKGKEMVKDWCGTSPVPYVPRPYVPRLPRETKVMSQSATPATQSAATCLQVPRLPRKCSYMSPSATPVTQKAAATTATAENRARHQSQPSAIRVTPAT